MATTAVSSNLDVGSIVSQLMAVERKPVNALKVKEANYQAKLSAFGSIKGAVGGFQNVLASLSNAAKFQSLKATPADGTVFAASASSIAAAGTYSLEVSKLAQAQKLVTTGQVSSTTSIGNGTLTFDFGSIAGGALGVDGKYTGASFTANGNGAKTVTIEANNNSLQGIRDAINAAKVGVTATIINDGGTSPYRLALSSDNLGASNSIKISVAGDAALANLLGHNPAATQNLSETAAAQNAEFKVDGVAISKASNTVSDVIQGVTLTLQKITTSPTSLVVARDTATTKSSIESFVKAFNDLNKALKESSAYNSATQQGAILQGDATIRTLQTQMRAVLNTAISHTDGALTTLSQIGVAFLKDGTLSLDSAKLNIAINNNFSDIANLFAAVGKASDSLVNFTSAASGTRPGSYTANITQLATQGVLSGNAAAGLDITAGSNDTLQVTVNNILTTVTLSAATYTAATLAAEVQSKINGASVFKESGLAVTVTHNAGVFSINSNSYGASSAVSVAGNGALNLLGATPVVTAGVDVAGTLNGQPATGAGQSLVANTGDAAGLKILVVGGALGARGNVYYSQGYAHALNILADSLLANDGALSGRTNGLNSSIKDIAKQRDTLEARLGNLEARYRKQFSALDTMLGNMNQTSTYLTQQLASLQNLK